MARSKVKGAHKGGAFERTCAKRLSLWATNEGDSSQLIRSVSSGGWARGRHASEGWRQTGDLAPNGLAGEELLARFGVECKTRASFDWWHFWTKQDDKTTLAFWWQKIRNECNEARQLPMLIFTTKFRPVMVGLVEAFLQIDIGRRAVLGFDEDTMVVAQLDAFLAHSPTEIYELADDAIVRRFGPSK